MDLTNKSQLLNYLKQHNLWAKKGLSQNFLVDKEALNKIVDAAELKTDDFVIEVGPGPGNLTSELVKNAGEVSAIEMDKEYADLLPNVAQGASLKVICDDVLKVNLDELIGGRKYKVVANIPYHITSKILELFLSRENKPELMVLLVQKEVAERICAKSGEMSVLAVSVQFYGQPEIIDIVKKESFFPSPKVDSVILKIVLNHPRGETRIHPWGVDLDEKAFFRCVHIGFAARRKTLLNNLMNGYQLDRAEVIDIITSIGLKETIRAQELSVEDWNKLTQKINLISN